MVCLALAFKGNRTEQIDFPAQHTNFFGVTGLWSSSTTVLQIKSAQDHFFVSLLLGEFEHFTPLAALDIRINSDVSYSLGAYREGFLNIGSF